MIKFKNISVKKRLMIVLLIGLSIFVNFGILAIKQMSHLGDVTRAMYNHSFRVSSAATEIRVDIIKIQRATRDLILSRNEEERQRAINDIRMLDKITSHNLVIMKNQVTESKIIEIEMQIEEDFLKWQVEREEVISLIQKGEIEQATHLTKDDFAFVVKKLEHMLVELGDSSKEKAYELVMESRTLEVNQIYMLVGLIALLGAIFLAMFVLIIKSILSPINDLKQAMNESINTEKLVLVNIDGENEIAEMSQFYNSLIIKLRNIFWIKDHKNILNQKLSGYHTLEELAQNTINNLCRTVSGGTGAFYMYENEEKLLKLIASYACPHNKELPKELLLGEGIVGQVALEKKSILLKTNRGEKGMISTALMNHYPTNSYVFPVVYEEDLYGVIEIASLDPLGEIQLDYLEEASETIAINLYATKQNAKILELLNISEKAREEVDKKAEELEEANKVLYSQRSILQQQAKELQHTNSQLEKQQQLLQQQTMLLNDQNLKLEEAKQDLEVSNKYKSDFLANMSHELRTPLNSIILLSKLLLNNKKESLKVKEKEKIQVIHKAGEELLRLINDILDLSKIESGKINIENNFFHSTLFIKEIEDMFKSLVKEKKLELKVEDYVKDKLYGDEYKIAQILRNFISNGIKFTHKGSITVQVKKDAEGTYFSVRDTGIGISKEQQKVIFEQFQQGDSSISRKYGGTGLGLSISKKLAGAMGGCIKVNSNLEEGSEFILYIPNVIKPKDKEVSTIEYLEPLGERDEAILVVEDNKLSDSHLMNTKDEQDLSLKDKKILIVDDDPRNVYSLASALEDAHAHVIEAYNGMIALAKLEEEPTVDLILMDIMMPEMDGYEAIRQINQNNKFRHIPIIALTAKSLKIDQDKCIEVGANAYISKPVDYDNLVKVIKEWTLRSNS